MGVGNRREGTFRPRAAPAGFSRPEAGSVEWPRSHCPKLANKATKAVPAGPEPDSCHSRGPAPPPRVFLPSSPESPADVSRQSQPQTTLQNQTEAALQRAAPLPASHQSRTRAQQLSHRQPGPGKPCDPGSLQRGLPAGGFCLSPRTRSYTAACFNFRACSLQTTGEHAGWVGGRVALRFLPHSDASRSWFILEKVSQASLTLGFNALP